MKISVAYANMIELKIMEQQCDRYNTVNSYKPELESKNSFIVTSKKKYHDLKY